MANELFRKIGEKELYVVRDNEGRIVVSDELFNSLIDDFEKQIPKKPIDKTHPDNVCARIYENFDIIVCPTCGKRLKLKSKGKYCDKCGQRLEW